MTRWCEALLFITNMLHELYDVIMPRQWTA